MYETSCSTVSKMFEMGHMGQTVDRHQLPVTVQELARDIQPQVPTTVESLTREPVTSSTQARVDSKEENSVSRSGEGGSLSTISSSISSSSSTFSLTSSSQTCSTKLDRGEQNSVSRSGEEASSSTIFPSMSSSSSTFPLTTSSQTWSSQAKIDREEQNIVRSGGETSSSNTSSSMSSSTRLERSKTFSMTPSFNIVTSLPPLPRSHSGTRVDKSNYFRNSRKLVLSDTNVTHFISMLILRNVDSRDVRNFT